MFGNRVALNQGLGGARDVTSAIISHEQIQSNRVCCFQTLDDVFSKDLFSDYFDYKIFFEGSKNLTSISVFCKMISSEMIFFPGYQA